MYYLNAFNYSPQKILQTYKSKIALYFSTQLNKYDRDLTEETIYNKASWIIR